MHKAIAKVSGLVGPVWDSSSDRKANKVSDRTLELDGEGALVLVGGGVAVGSHRHALAGDRPGPVLEQNVRVGDIRESRGFFWGGGTG